MSVEAYPLYWPDGWPRSKYQQSSKFKTGFGAARVFLSDEISRMGGKNVVISTNVPLRNDGMPRASAPEPKDAGVAVYFRYKDKDMVFACDKFWYTRDNIYAIGKTIEALRGIERWGASDMMERAFSGFKRLNAENETLSWWQILQVEAHAVPEEIEAAYRRLARTAHPDTSTGSHDAMAALNAAREMGLAAARGGQR